MVTHTMEGVYVLVQQDMWDKMRRMIAELHKIEKSEKYGMDMSKMELVCGVLVYVTGSGPRCPLFLHAI